MAKLVMALSLLVSLLAGCADTGTSSGMKPDYERPPVYRGGGY